MKRIHIISLLTALCIIVSSAFIKYSFFDKEANTIKIGFIYIGDSANPYTKNFLRTQEAIEEKYGNQVECFAKYNIQEGAEKENIQDLIEKGCDIIFGTSYGYGTVMKEMAQANPEIIFCQATGDNINNEPVLNNYYTFMGHIYEGRYISGVIAGMKLNEMIQNGTISKEEALIGYVAAYPYAEVISGYTAFLLGVRSVCPNAIMNVRYTYTWSNFSIEKKMAENFINEGCVLISQHSDTKGPAIACEENRNKKEVYHISYNQSMKSVAPTTSLTGCRINWEAFELVAIDALLHNKRIEDNFSSSVIVNGLDIGGGIQEGWVELLELNEAIIPSGCKEQIQQCIQGLANHSIQVFKGAYVGINPNNKSDVIDLKYGYLENQTSSAPSFNYVLQDVICIKED